MIVSSLHLLLLFYHLSRLVEGSQEAPELDLLAGAAHQPGLELRHLGQERDLDCGGEDEAVDVEMNLSQNIL